MRRDRVYVGPPGKIVTAEGDAFRLGNRPDGAELHRPIETFLASLAGNRGRDACRVILSGTGSGGSQRLQAVKAAGRFALVRESTGARFPGMPDAALATGLVDFILPVDKIARRLDEMAHHRQSIRSEDAQARIQGKVEAAVPRIAKALARVGATTSPSTSPARRSGGSRGG